MLSDEKITNVLSIFPYKIIWTGTKDFGTTAYEPRPLTAHSDIASGAGGQIFGMFYILYVCEKQRLWYVWAGSSEPSLLADVINIKILCVKPFTQNFS